MRQKIILFILLAALTLTSGCGNSSRKNKEVLLATTTSTYDSGLLDDLLRRFEEQSSYRVKVISLGTGQALALGKNGDADVVLVHDTTEELRMVAEGYYVERMDVMYNDFVIVGPPGDPAGLAGYSAADEVFFALAKAGSIFVSRGDGSGTHKKEISLWDSAGVSPAGTGYISAGAGMGNTLRMADEMKGYTLTDRATYLSLKHSLDSVILFSGDESLRNLYGIMAVNPDLYPSVNYEGALALIRFMRSPAGQKQIRDFQPYGEILFYPVADSED
jgi:tungstate transport system substrate-binding protein